MTNESAHMKMLKAFQAEIKEKCNGKLRLRFVGLDGWDRPVFKDDSITNMFFGDVDHIFKPSDSKEKIFEYYRERRLNLDRILTYFGKAFRCEAWGIPLTGIDVKIVED